MYLISHLHIVFKVFDGNTDRATVVTNVIDPPIIARFVRIHPQSWSSHISMRAEFFGCRDGEC